MQGLEEDGFGSNPESTTPIYEVRLNAGRFDVTMAERLYYSVNSDNGNTSLVPYDISGSVGNVTLRLMEEGQNSYYKVEQVGFLTFLFFGIVIANITVLLATTLSKQGFKSRMTFFIMHLAIADLMVGLVSVLTDLLWKATGYWYAGNVMCHLVRYLQAVAMFASTYVLVALSIDRLEAIARPMSFHNSRTRARILIVAAWILSGLMALPLLVLFEETGDPEHRQCGMRLPSLFYWKLYVTLLATCLFFIPTLIISMCYCIIIYVIWSKARTVTSSSRSNKSKRLVKRFARKTSKNDAGLYPDSNDLKSSTDCSQSSKGVIPQAKIRTIKLTLIIVIVFILCWSPYFIFNLLDVFGHVPSSPNKRAISILIGSLAPLNSLANPIIYGIFTTMIYKNLRRVRCFGPILSRFCCRCSCCCPPSGRRQDSSGSVYMSTRPTYVASSSTSETPSRRQRAAISVDGNNTNSSNDINNDILVVHTLYSDGKYEGSASHL